MERIRGNVTESIASTVAPMRDALKDLVAVTSSTIQSLADPKPPNSQRINGDQELVDNQGRAPTETRHEEDHHDRANFNPQPIPMRQPIMTRNGLSRH